MAHKPRRVDETFAGLIRLFQQAPKWRLSQEGGGYADATKDAWSRELAFMEHPTSLGGVPIEELRPKVVQAFFDKIADRPGKQAQALSVLRQLEKWAIVRELLSRQITLGVEINHSGGGHIPWTDEQVALAETHLRSDLARAITLFANTGQRGSDVVRMGPTDIETFQGIAGINVRQKKTKRQVWVPITTELAAAMETWERRPGPFLLRPDGRPWTRKELYNAFVYDRSIKPELAPLLHLVPHGLRGHACVRLRRAGASIPQIADMVGMSEEMVARYCRFSLQKENAVAAVLKLMPQTEAAKSLK